MTLAYSRPARIAWKPAALAFGLVVAAMLLGQVATTPNLPWYASLNKPWFTPPNWLFGPVWTVLYFAMAYMFYRVMRLPRAVGGRDAAIAAFVVLLVINTLWSFVFFAGHALGWGLVDIAAQAVVLVVTAALFARLDGPVALGFLPVALWLSYAGALNYWIWLHN